MRLLIHYWINCRLLCLGLKLVSNYKCTPHMNNDLMIYMYIQTYKFTQTCDLHPYTARKFALHSLYSFIASDEHFTLCAHDITSSTLAAHSLTFLIKFQIDSRHVPCCLRWLITDRKISTVTLTMHEWISKIYLRDKSGHKFLNYFVKMELNSGLSVTQAIHSITEWSNEFEPWLCHGGFKHIFM
jgi:hypothetical protein